MIIFLEYSITKENAFNCIVAGKAGGGGKHCLVLFARKVTAMLFPPCPYLLKRNDTHSFSFLLLAPVSHSPLLVGGGDDGGSLAVTAGHRISSTSGCGYRESTSEEWWRGGRLH